MINNLISINYKNLFLITFLFILSSCSTSICSPTDKLNLAKSHTNKITDSSSSGLNTDKSLNMKTVKVYKLDGSVQCEPNSGKPITEIQTELSNIKIISSKSSHDGLMRTQVCGQPTGNCFVFEISETDLDKALKYGFKIWKND